MRLASPITAAFTGLALFAAAGQAAAQKMVFDVDIVQAATAQGAPFTPYDAHFQQRFLTNSLHQDGSYSTNVATMVSTQQAHAFGGTLPLSNLFTETLINSVGLGGNGDEFAQFALDGTAVRGGGNNPYAYAHVVFDSYRSSVHDIGGGLFQGAEYRLTLDGYLQYESMDGGLGNDLFAFTELDYDGITALLARMGPINYRVYTTDGTYTPAAGDTYTYVATSQHQYAGYATFNAAASAAVPEAATWALMILGFGGVGAMLRRRTRPAALAA